MLTISKKVMFVLTYTTFFVNFLVFEFKIFFSFYQVRYREKFKFLLLMISELDNTGVIEDNDKDLPEDGDESKEVTEEMMDSADEKRSAAMAAFSEGRSMGVFSKQVGFFLL